jgi:hypothetical protein
MCENSADLRLDQSHHLERRVETCLRATLNPKENATPSPEPNIEDISSTSVKCGSDGLSD